MTYLDWFFRPLLSRIIQLEYRIMAKIDDSTSRIEASTTAALTSIQTEIQQLSAAVSAGNGGSDDALAARLDALSDKIDAAKAALDADDPAAPTDPNA